MTRYLNFILGFVLAASLASAGIVRYGIESNGTALPARPITNFTGAMSCSDDADAGKTVCSAGAFWFDGGSGSMYTTATVSNPDGGTGIVFSTASGAYAAAMAANGARLDFGTGSIDYAASDGTGIETPSYWESTRAFGTGPGVIAPAVKATGASATSMTAANANSLTAGALLHNSTLNRMTQVVDANDGGYTFMPLGAADLMDKQTLSVRVMGNNINTYPQVSERIPCTSYSEVDAGVVQMHWSGLLTTTNNNSSAPYTFGTLYTDGDAQRYGYTACSTLPTSLYRPVRGSTGDVNTYVGFCQRLSLGDLNQQTVWSLLSSDIPTNNSTSMGGIGLGFRYSNSIGANWYACYNNGVTTCADTGVAAVAGVPVVLCAYQRGTTSASASVLTFTIDGIYRQTAVVTPISGNLAPIVVLDATSGAHVLGVGALKVESQ